MIHCAEKLFTFFWIKIALHTFLIFISALKEYYVRNKPILMVYDIKIQQINFTKIPYYIGLVLNLYKIFNNTISIKTFNELYLQIKKI